MIKLLVISLLMISNAFAQAIYVDDSFTHGNGKVTATTPTDNVGIGSSNPTQKLDVSGSVKVSGNVAIGSTVASSKLEVIGGGIKGELVNKTWEVIPAPTALTTTGVTFSEINSMGIYKGDLYVGYDVDGTSGVIKSDVYKWDGNSLAYKSTIGTSSAFGGVTFLQEYKNNLYAGIQGNALTSGDVYVSTDSASTWTKSYDTSSNQFAYSAAVFKGKLYVGMGYATGRIMSFDGTTWTEVYNGSGTGLILSLYVFNGKLFAGSGNTASKIISTEDGVTWTEEASYLTTVYTEINHFQEFRGKLYAGVIEGVSGTNDILVRDNSTGTWSVLWADIPGSQVWQMANYNDVLYFGSSKAATLPVTSAILYKSYDGLTYEADLQFNTREDNYEYEAFKMITYNGSLYVGMGGDGLSSATLWRKTDSLGQRFDEVNRYLKSFSLGGTNWQSNFGNDESALNISIPTNFKGNVGVGSPSPSAKLEVQGTVLFLNGNVGIGTTNPGRPLDINGNVRVRGTWAQYFGDTNNSFFVGGGESPVPTISAWINNIRKFKLLNASTDSAGFLQNVGIGTELPSAKLSVYQASAVDAVQVYDQANDTTPFVIDQSGNVGVGSATPGKELDVNGTVRATAFIGDGSLLTGISGSGSGTVSSGTADRVAIYDTAGTTVTSSSMLYDNGTNVGVGTSNPVSTFQVGANILRATSVGNVGVGTLNPEEALAVSGNVIADVVKVRGSGIANIASSTGSGVSIDGNNDSVGDINVTSTGNVGVGTTTLGAVSVLTVANSSNNPNNIRMVSNNSTGTNTGAWIMGETADTIGTFGVFPTTYTTVPSRAGWALLMAQTGSTGVGLDTDSSKPIKFAISGTEAARFNTSGNLGLGTTVPAQKLDVAGSVYISGNVGVGTVNPTAQNANYIFHIFNNANTNRALAITNKDTGGNAVTRLELVSNNTNGYLQNSATTFTLAPAWAGKTMLFNETGDGLILGTNSVSDPIQFMYGTTEVARVLGSNVGIGTVAPVQKLEVSGTVKATAFVGDGSGLTGVSGSGISGLTSNTVTKATSSTTIGNSQITDDGTNVGINQASPTQKLEVNGTVKATAFIGDGSGLTGLASGSGTVNTGTSGYYGYYPSTGTTIDDQAILYTEGTNIGIGSTNPTAKLDIAGHARINSTNRLYLGSDLNSNISMSAATSGEMQFVTGANTRMSVGVNVGIGTTVKGNRLSVNGGLGVGTNYASVTSPTGGAIFEGNVGIGSSAPSAPLEVNGGAIVRSATGTGTVVTLLNNSLTTGTVLAVSTTSSTSSNTGPLVDFARANATGNGSANVLQVRNLGTGASGNALFVTNGGTGNALYIEDVASDVSPTVIEAGGNMGIGTLTISDAKLLIKQTTNDNVGGLVIKNTGLTGSNRLWVDGTTNASRWDSGTAATGRIVLNGAGNGNVGISSVNPGKSLDVNGTVRALYFEGNGSLLSGISGGTGGWTDGTNIVTLTASTDNVGIGSATPSQKLDVDGTVRAIALTTSGTTAGSVELKETLANGANKITISAPSSLSADRSCTLEDDSTPFDTCVSSASGGWTDGTNVVTLTTSTDNVGIGTASPEKTLVVSKSAASEEGIKIKNTNAAGTAQLLFQNDGADVAFFNFNSSGNGAFANDLYIGNDAGELVFEAAGNMGINSSSPAATLDVVGTIRMSSGTSGQVVCYMSNGNLGKCTSIVGAGGGCTCVSN